MKHFRLLSLLVLLAHPARADVILLTNGNWRLEGVNGTGIKFGELGEFAEVRVIHDGQSIGRFTTDRIQLYLPGGVPGGSFALAGYWDCTAGYVPPLNIQSLDFLRVRKGGQLELTGLAGNNTSLVTRKLVFLLEPPTAAQVTVGVSYWLRATRDFCLDDSERSQGLWFQPASILSTAPTAGDTVRYDALLERRCIDFLFGKTCWKRHKILCAPVNNVDALAYAKLHKMNNRQLALVSSDGPAPTLALRFNRPSPKRLRPQAMTVASADPLAENVTVWPSWQAAKSRYRAGRSLGRFNFQLIARPAGSLPCDN